MSRCRLHRRPTRSRDFSGVAVQARGVAPNQVVKTLVVRGGEDGYLVILVPGDRQISWPKLRALLRVARHFMPNAETAGDVTG